MYQIMLINIMLTLKIIIMISMMMMMMITTITYLKTMTRFVSAKEMITSSLLMMKVAMRVIG
jgi:hypothetical protein